MIIIIMIIIIVVVVIIIIIIISIIIVIIIIIIIIILTCTFLLHIITFSGNEIEATCFTSFAMKSLNSDIVQVDTNPRFKVTATSDGNRIDFTQLNPIRNNGRLYDSKYPKLNAFLYILSFKIKYLLLFLIVLLIYV